LDKNNTKAAGIIVEFNPLHNGHLEFIRETRQITGRKNIIAVMSGNFVQRGEPALCDKWRRTKMALLAGVDVVIELPVPYVLGGADYFARGGVGLLAATGIVDCLCFGSESGDAETIKKCGKILAEEPPLYKKTLRETLDKGLSFAKARGEGLKAVTSAQSEDILTPDFFTQPNNTLGMEYCKVLELSGYPMKIFTSHRKKGGPSATAIRNILCTNEIVNDLTSNVNAKSMKNGFIRSENSGRSNAFSAADKTDSELSRYVPPYVKEILTEVFQKNETVRLNDFSGIFRYLVNKPDAPVLDEGLHNRFRRYVFEHTLLSDILAVVKTKRYTLTRLQRTALRIILGITDDFIREINTANTPPYIRILGFRTQSASIIGEIKRRACVPVFIHNAALDFNNKFLNKELEAGDIYRLAYKNNSASEYTQPVVKVTES
jgi:predicted nucleotidyltransferase